MAMLGLTAAVGAGGTWLLFLHLMQNSAPFAETVAKISPDIANRYSCSCPFCSGSRACLPAENEQGLTRFNGRYGL
jgi:hypothetical protein